MSNLPESVAPLSTLEDLRAACAALPGSQETFPFGPETLVFKVGGKMYALTSLNSDILRVSLKVRPEEGEALRAAWPGIRPGYHLNKRHWVTVDLGREVNGADTESVPFDSVPAELAGQLLHESHALVVASLTRAKRAEHGLEQRFPPEGSPHLKTL